MTVSTEKLARMAQQIAANMNYGEDIEIVGSKVAEHINKFWDQRMITAFREYAAQHREEFSAELNAAVLKLD
ncbi:MAG: formate dehydrogenase subunit delta [Proteobacteria bacterium]|nr:formate dehydrogenase subunit delta [Pseudomonadota bacterium]